MPAAASGQSSEKRRELARPSRSHRAGPIPLGAARSWPSRAHRAAVLRQSVLQDTGLQDCLLDGPEVH